MCKLIESGTQNQEPRQVTEDRKTEGREQ